MSLTLWGPVAAYMAALFALSSQATLPGVSLTPDWTQHGMAYAGLAIVTLRATAGGRWSGVGARAVSLAWVIAALYGVTDEWHQAFVPGRMADVRDVAADAVGAALGLAAAWAWSIIRRPS
ncbi:MAG: VanZ family protein [Vicinamibacterales bacterium]